MNRKDMNIHYSNREAILSKIKTHLISRIFQELENNPTLTTESGESVRQYLEDSYEQLNVDLPAGLRDQLFRDVLDELLGYGPIQMLLEDPEITEIMVNGSCKTYIEKNGKLIKTKVKFESDNHVLKVIDRIIHPLGRYVDSDHPAVDARLPDGSRVNAVIPPVAIDGPSITIRKFSKERLSTKQLINYGSITEQMAEFLRACVEAHLTIVISGGTGSGKTTLLNVLSSFIPESERIVTIEDSAELQLLQEHVVRLETKTPNVEGTGSVTIRDLVRNSLRMRPDRIVVGEVRGGEAIDMLQAMNTGHDGSLTTLHANSPRDALSRLETMALMSDLEIPINVVRKQIASAVDLIVQQSRLRDGTRKITSITEVAGMEGDVIVMTEIFQFVQKGIDSAGNVMGEFKPTGIRPMFGEKLEQAGFKLGAELFGVVGKSPVSENRKQRRR